MRDKILKDLTEAMKAQEKEKLTVIRAIKGAMMLEEINLKHTLTDDELIGVIAKQVKTRKESIIEFEKGNRQDLIEQAKNEIKILEEYLPEQITKEEAIKIIEDAFDTIKPTSSSDMGKIMGLITPKIKGKFDMKEASSIVKEKISNL